MNKITITIKEQAELLEALVGMWDQYCGGGYGHAFMTAGENAYEVLKKYRLLKDQFSPTKDVYDYEAYLYQLKQETSE